MFVFLLYCGLVFCYLLCVALDVDDVDCIGVYVVICDCLLFGVIVAESVGILSYYLVCLLVLFNVTVALTMWFVGIRVADWLVGD